VSREVWQLLVCDETRFPIAALIRQEPVLLLLILLVPSLNMSGLDEFR